MIDARNLLSDSHKNIAISATEYAYYETPSYRYIGVSDKNYARDKKLERYHNAPKLSKCIKMEFDTTQAGEIILKKVSGINSPVEKTEIGLTIPGLEGK